MPSQGPPPLLLALAGPTSSGKTTIATALALIFDPSPTEDRSLQSINQFNIIHADDFYLSESQIPLLPNGTQDWDCPEALDLPKLRAVLGSVREGGNIPLDLVRQGGLEDCEREHETKADGKDTARAIPKEERKDELDGVHGVKSSLIATTTIAALRHKVSRWPKEAKERRIVLVEGILLFSPQAPLSTLTDLFDIKILLRATRTAAKRRREARAGYVTLDGFWKDPPEYFDEVVWPGFVKVYGALFLDGDVEGLPDQEQIQKLGVKMGPLSGKRIHDEVRERKDAGLEDVLIWVIDVLEKALVSQRKT